ncbi:Lrp/AsnC family transcriptional regulator [Sphingomonas paeninsulae]|uniref:Lrp/AsnC family transcriptional regulator n=1 Tax=Sphingomonas paeninsulae TaxID=2319844 RepID=A0A494TBP7_SPHPE|nr:Lrp/AsnC family transcriptional regulator [Sphingomonas paeninsulae]AYJ86869.1 Lrp/AsnC family transcriptional regulator [Sphingomonas paeninsulae]
MSSSAAGDGTLDALDIRILQTLTKQGRIGWRDLADTIGLSLTPTLRRVRRLESEGYIEGYTAILNEHRLTGSVNAFVSVTLERQSDSALSLFETEITTFHEVMGCYMMTGTADYLIQVVVRDLDHFQLLLRKLTALPHVAHVQTSFALKALIQRSSRVLNMTTAT